MSDLFYSLITKFQNIYIFRHQNPDYDAYGSQLALALWLTRKYPTKNIQVAGYDLLESKFPMPEVNKISVVEPDSLGIVLDCSNAQRVDDVRFEQCKTTLLIDHHPKQEVFTTYQMVDTSKPATCQLLGELMLEIDPILAYNEAVWLYAGIMTDTLNLTINATTADTFSFVSRLINTGINPTPIHQLLYGYDFHQFVFANHIRSKATLSQEGLLTVEVTMLEITEYNVTMQFAKDLVKEFDKIAQNAIWVLYYEVSPDVFNASIRSVEIPINGVASQFGGGGHALASGVKNLDRTSMLQLEATLKVLLKGRNYVV